MVELRENEQKTLLALQKLNGKASVDRTIEVSGLAHAAVMRAALTLSEKKLVKVHEQKQKVVELTEEGKQHAQYGLPERRIINAIIESNGTAPIGNIAQKAQLDEKLVPIALGWLHRKGWATVEGKQTLKTQKKDIPREADEKLLSMLRDKTSVTVDELHRDMQDAVSVLKGRKLLEVPETTVRQLELTNAGRQLVRKGVELISEVSQLTPELIISQKWREVKLRKFDVSAAGPELYPAKAHPLQQVIQKAREIFLELGFTEIRGPLVETAFWNFDALFQPQDHPAREMMDTFYLANPKAGALPKKSVVNAVARTHENGWTTGSKGWGYKWSPEEAKRLVMRTHTTAETIKYLSKHKKPPIKVFSVDRVYRNEQLTFKNTAEFHQIEGIVVDKGVTLRDLMGTLKTFYSRFGLKKVRFWPCYFPYTEPSAEATVFVPKLKRWIELCGMGMFRPEVLAPMGIKYPVLAWGGGLERLAMLELGIEDIRQLYGNNLSWIRRTPLCQ
ncbi:MAG TPA: phenylalanine--tRNA ligase subunit alpha [Candidatus Bathyarchaeia archaeon]|nr:phenylalanine--tRNA ligase subunit alpha [Candidatus Bathyarchaeia archaeon]